MHRQRPHVLASLQMAAAWQQVAAAALHAILIDCIRVIKGVAPWVVLLFLPFATFAQGAAGLLAATGLSGGVALRCGVILAAWANGQHTARRHNVKPQQLYEHFVLVDGGLLVAQCRRREGEERVLHVAQRTRDLCLRVTEEDEEDAQ